MRKHSFVFAALVLVFCVLSCNQNAPVATDQTESVALSKEAYEVEWTAYAADWEPMGIVPSCDDPCSFAQMCGGDPDVILEIPGPTMWVSGRKVHSPISGDFDNPSPNGIRMTLDAKIDHLGNGYGRGLIEINASMGDLSGTFRGSYEVKFTDELCTGSFTAKGMSGEFADRQLRGRFVESADSFMLQGLMGYSYPGD